MSIRHWRVGDTRTALGVVLQQANTAGTLTAVDLTGSTVEVEMVNSATGVDKIARTSTGVSIITAASGIVEYTFSAGGVNEAGIFWMSFVVTTSSKTDHFPTLHDKLEVHICSDTLSAQEAYEAALS